jgi:hypothetical protein
MPGEEDVLLIRIGSEEGVGITKSSVSIGPEIKSVD